LNFWPGFQVQLDGLAQISASIFDIGALRCDTQFWAAGHVKVFFFGDEDRESVGHMGMLALQALPGKNSRFQMLSRPKKLKVQKF